MESSLSLADWAIAALLVAVINNRGKSFFMFKFRPSLFVILALLTVLMLACDGNNTSARLALADGWVRGMPPGMNMTAAYGRFVNSGDGAIEIVALESDSFASVSLHQTTTEAGTSHMKPVDVWSIEPGATAVLEPGGLHLMMMQPRRELAVGSTVKLSLTSNSGRSYHFTLKVEAR